MIVNRKKFIKTIGLATLAALSVRSKNLFGQTSNSSSSTNSNKSNSVLILGGGLSGLYAANLLKKKGVQIQVVEASPRLGGRIMSIQNPKDQSMFDLGGEWIGDFHSLTRKLVANLGLTLVRPNWTSGPTLWDMNKLSLKSKENLEKLIEYQSKIPSNQIEGLDKISLFRYLRYQGFSDMELDELDLVVKTFYGESSKNISSYALLSSLESKKSLFQNFYKVEGGAYQIISKLVNILNSNDIILSDKAVIVSQTKEGIEVILESGRRLKAKELICTLPAPAVSQIKFEPGLPREKIYGLLRLGYGKIHKEIIELETPLLSPEKGEGIIDWILPSNNNYATITISEGRAIALENSNSLIAEGLLTKSMGAKMVTSFLSLGQSRDGFGNGAVSIYNPSTYGIKEELSSSFGPIHFAGEHIGEVSGTMEAAISSAILAVRKIT
ncbi:MAG: hypothetical protein CK427_11960 [Leptospira sp.]|nr:MAG: hypothetical protein CK427_11960 [Leptospira sp.]